MELIIMVLAPFPIGFFVRSRMAAFVAFIALHAFVFTFSAPRDQVGNPIVQGQVIDGFGGADLAEQLVGAAFVQQPLQVRSTQPVHHQPGLVAFAATGKPVRSLPLKNVKLV